MNTRHFFVGFYTVILRTRGTRDLRVTINKNDTA